MIKQTGIFKSNPSKYKRDYMKNWRNRNKENYNKWRKENYKKNREKINIQTRVRRSKNKEKIKQQRREFYLRHRDKIKKSSREYRLKNLEKVKERQKEWRLKNREKLSKEQRTPERRFKSYEWGAQKRKIPFLLSKEQFLSFVNKPCFFCGAIPFPIGIDRLDSNKKIGYTIENCVSCCGRCNVMKNYLNYEEFINHITKIINKYNAFQK